MSGWSIPIPGLTRRVVVPRGDVGVATIRRASATRSRSRCRSTPRNASPSQSCESGFVTLQPCELRRFQRKHFFGTPWAYNWLWTDSYHYQNGIFRHLVRTGWNIRGVRGPDILTKVTVDGSCRASIGAGRAWPVSTGWAERPRMTATSRSGKRLKQPRIVNT